jgi:hypothetical protein
MDTSKSPDRFSLCTLNKQAEAGGLTVARLNSAEPTLWAPEMISFGIEAVPCFVLVDSRGMALGKSGPPTSKERMLSALRTLQTRCS